MNDWTLYCKETYFARNLTKLKRKRKMPLRNYQPEQKLKVGIGNSLSWARICFLEEQIFCHENHCVMKKTIWRTLVSSGSEVETTSRKKMICNYSSSLGKQKKAHRLDYDDTMKSDLFRPISPPLNSNSPTFDCPRNPPNPEKAEMNLPRSENWLRLRERSLPNCFRFKHNKFQGNP